MCIRDSLHAECVEFVFEFHDELLEEFEILLAGLVSVDRVTFVLYLHYDYSAGRHYF